MELTVKKINIIIDALKKSNGKEAKEIIEELESLPVRMDSASEQKNTRLNLNCLDPGDALCDNRVFGMPTDCITRYDNSVKKKSLK